MKKLILLLFLLPTIAFGQTTLIPDVIFEQRLILLGYDTGPIDGSVLTANISGVTSLIVSGYGISDLTGIEDFASLIELRCGGNQLTSLDVSQNTALTTLWCNENNLMECLNVKNGKANFEEQNKLILQIVFAGATKQMLVASRNQKLTINPKIRPL